MLALLSVLCCAGLAPRIEPAARTFAVRHAGPAPEQAHIASPLLAHAPRTRRATVPLAVLSIVLLAAATFVTRSPRPAAPALLLRRHMVRGARAPPAVAFSN
jgi:hypothetical protein